MEEKGKSIKARCGGNKGSYMVENINEGNASRVENAKKRNTSRLIRDYIAQAPLLLLILIITPWFKVTIPLKLLLELWSLLWVFM